MSVMIEDKPLSPQQASAIMELLGHASIKGSVASDFIAAMLSLQRIAAGVDAVAPVDQSLR